MRHARASLGLVTASLLLACGGPPARTPTDGALTVPPAKRDATAPAPPAKRPDELAAWLHAEDPDAIVELAGARPMLQLGMADEEIGKWLAVVDLTKPVDLVVTTTPPKKKAKKKKSDTAAAEDDGPPKPGIEAAARFRVKDVGKAIDALRKNFDVTVEGTGIRAVLKKKEPPKEDTGDESEGTHKEPAEPDEPTEVFCDFGGAKTGPEFAVCGSAHAMTVASAWLRTGPRPPENERMRTAAKASELLRLSAYLAPLRPFLDGKPKDDLTAASTKTATEKETEKAIEASLRDLTSVGFELAREGDQVTFAMGSWYGSRKSALTQATFEPTSGVAPTDAFLRITEDASASMFIPGGGPVAAAMRWILKEATNDLAPEKKAAFANALPIVARMADRPLEAGYGIDAPRVKKAIAAARTDTKDPRKTSKALEEALGGFEVARIPVEIGSAETLARAYVKSENDKEKEKQATAAQFAAGALASATGSSGSVAKAPKTPLELKGTKQAWAVRPVPAKLGLPKGAFAVDETKSEWVEGSTTAAGKPSPGTWRKSTDTAFFVPGPGARDKSATWIVTCDDDASCAERAKAAIAEKPPTSTTRDVLFQQPGLLAAGHLSTLVGAFALHRLQLQMASNAAFGAGASAKTPISGSTLTEIEHHFAEPKLLLPFVTLAQSRGEGGLVLFEIRGQREAWKELGEHAGAAASGSMMLVGMFLALALAAGP